MGVWVCCRVLRGGQKLLRIASLLACSADRCPQTLIAHITIQHLAKQKHGKNKIKFSVWHMRTVAPNIERQVPCATLSRCLLWKYLIAKSSDLTNYFFGVIQIEQQPILEGILCFLIYTKMAYAFGCVLGIDCFSISYFDLNCRTTSIGATVVKAGFSFQSSFQEI